MSASASTPALGRTEHGEKLPPYGDWRKAAPGAVRAPLRRRGAAVADLVQREGGREYVGVMDGALDAALDLRRPR